MSTLKHALLATTLVATFAGTAGLASAATTRSVDPYTDGAAAGSERDVFTQGARSGPRDAFTDGARAGTRDIFTDGANTSVRDSRFDGA